jgi:hypothetical protein
MLTRVRARCVCVRRGPVSGTGAVGFINMIDLFSKGKQGEAFFCLVVVVLWCISLAINLVLFLRVRLHYRRRGHSFQEARNQAMTRAATSSVAQSAVQTAATTAVSSAASGYARQYDEA